MAANRILSGAGSTQILDANSAADPRAGLPTNMSVAWIAMIGSASLDVAALHYLYRVAYEKARQALEPPGHYRQLFNNWN
jgi:hypothetical protein